MLLWIVPGGGRGQIALDLCQRDAYALCCWSYDVYHTILGFQKNHEKNSKIPTWDPPHWTLVIAIFGGPDVSMEGNMPSEGLLGALAPHPSSPHARLPV